MKDDNDDLLKRFALAMVSGSPEQMKQGMDFVNLAFGGCSWKWNMEDRVELKWRVRPESNALVLFILREVVNGSVDAEIDIGPLTLKFYDGLLHSHTDSEGFECATISCEGVELLMFLFLLYSIWNGSIGANGSPLSFDRKNFEDDVIKGFWEMVEPVT